MTDKKILDRTNAAAVLTSMSEGNSFSTKAIDANVRYVGSTGAKLDGTIHATAVACIYLSMPHVDGGHNCAIRAANLVNAMPRSSRRKALIAWFSHYSNVRFVLDKQGVATGSVLKPTNKLYEPADPGAAMLKPFWSVEEKDVDPSQFDDQSLAKLVASILKKATGDNAALSDAMKAKLLAFGQDVERMAPIIKSKPVHAGLATMAVPAVDPLSIAA